MSRAVGNRADGAGSTGLERYTGDDPKIRAGGRPGFDVYIGAYNHKRGLPCGLRRQMVRILLQNS